MESGIAIAVTELLVACGGEAVVDGAVESSACQPFEPRAFLMCHGAVGFGPSGRVCSNRCLDEEGHAFESVCQHEQCECFFDDELACSCAYHAADSCGTPCCPEPWQ